MSNWKRISEELPRPYEIVLVRTISSSREIGYFDIAERKWHLKQANKTNEMIVAWCPIPEYDLND